VATVRDTVRLWIVLLQKNQHFLYKAQYSLSVGSQLMLDQIRVEINSNQYYSKSLFHRPASGRRYPKMHTLEELLIGRFNIVTL